MTINSKIIVSLSLFLLLASCAASGTSITNNPSLFSKIANSDLSARQSNGRYNSQYNGRRGRGGRTFEKYVGQDGLPISRHNFQGAKKTGDGYELNFSNADLSQLTKVILQDTLNIPYVFDPRVQGKVTLSTGKMVSREELLFTLETILQMNNGAMVKEGEQYKIIPSAIARVGRAVNVNYRNERKRIGPGYGITIFPLQYVSSDVMQNILKAFTNKQNGIKASIDGNILFIRGPGRERRTLVEVAQSFDVDWMKGQSAGIYVLKNTAPEDIIPELEKIFRTKNGVGKGVVRFQQIKRLNAILVLTQKSTFLEKVAVWVKRLDRTNVEAENLFVYRVENGKAKDLANILNQMFSGGGSPGGNKPSGRQVSPGQTSIKLSSPGGTENKDSDPKPGAPGGTERKTLTTTTSDFGGGRASTMGAVRIIPDEINNKLLIRASGRDYRKILKVLKRIDQAPLQVLINATLAEVTLNDNLKYGVQFYLQKAGGSKGAISFSAGDALKVTANSFPGLNFVLGSIAEPKVVLDALSSKTNVKVVSSPSVVVLHNQTASLQVGDEVPIATRQASSVNDTQAPIVNEIQFRNTGVILKVTPRVNSNGLVTMEIEQEISSVSKTTATGSGTLTPTISQRKVASTIAVNSGQMVVLGGLISEQTNKDKSGIPGINKIPVIGDIVGATNDRGTARTELVIFLQPTVIRDAQDAADIAESVRAGLMKFAPKKRQENRPNKFKSSEGWQTAEQKFK